MMRVRWVRHRRKAPIQGCKAHGAADRDGEIVRKIASTPANVGDGWILGIVPTADRGPVYAELADAVAANADEIRTAGGRSLLSGRGSCAARSVFRQALSFFSAFNRLVPRHRHVAVAAYARCRMPRHDSRAYGTALSFDAPSAPR